MQWLEKSGNKVIKSFFKEGRVDNSEIFTLDQRKAWSRLTSKESLAEFTYVQWCLNPRDCLIYQKEKMKMGCFNGRETFRLLLCSFIDLLLSDVDA